MYVPREGVVHDLHAPAFSVSLYVPRRHQYRFYESEAQLPLLLLCSVILSIG